MIINQIASGGGGGIDTFDATAYPQHIFKDYTAYARGSKIVGTYEPIKHYVAMEFTDASASSSYDSSQGALKAIDNNSNSWWAPQNIDPIWIKLDMLESFVCTKYMIQARSDSIVGMASGWLFQGLDGSTWVTLDTRSGITWESVSQRKEFIIENNLSFSSYRFYNIVWLATGYRGIAEIRLFKDE